MRISLDANAEMLTECAPVAPVCLLFTVFSRLFVRLLLFRLSSPDMQLERAVDCFFVVVFLCQNHKL